MNQKEFLKGLKEFYDANLEIAKRKNADYASEDAFHNFKIVEQLGLTTTEKGIAVRMCDKMTRISNLLDNPPQVKDESILDSLSDLSNYSGILYLRIKNKK